MRMMMLFVWTDISLETQLFSEILQIYSDSLVESVHAVRQRHTPISFVLLFFLMFRVSLSAKGSIRDRLMFYAL